MCYSPRKHYFCLVKQAYMNYCFTFLFGISGGEILVLLLLVLLLFGPGKIPEVARMIGRGLSEVKKVQREINTEINKYSAEIENESRKMRSGIDELSADGTSENKQSTASADDDVSRSEDAKGDDVKTAQPSGQEPKKEHSPPRDVEQPKEMEKGESSDQDDDLPFPYRK